MCSLVEEREYETKSIEYRTFLETLDIEMVTVGQFYRVPYIGQVITKLFRFVEAQKTGAVWKMKMELLQILFFLNWLIGI